MLGKKLTAAQLEAAKNRMVGRAPPGVATRPSVNGFRPSEPVTSKQRQINAGPTARKNKAKVTMNQKSFLNFIKKFLIFTQVPVLDAYCIVLKKYRYLLC